MRIIKNNRGAPAILPRRRLSRVVGLLVASAALAAPPGGVLAAPQPVRQPLPHPVDDQGLLDSVASRGSQLISTVRDGTSNLLDSAMNFLGVRYKLGGSNAQTGFDCSGFTRYVFENSIGHVLPHRAEEQANDPGLAKVERKDLKPGDLVFFDTMRRTFSHVGIYLGDGKFIHSPRLGETVRIEDINISYWARRFTGGRRAPELANTANAANGGTGGTLASFTSRLSDQARALMGGGNGAADTPAAMAASLNPSGLSLGSTLPPAATGTPTAIGPTHQPFARALPER